MSPDVSRVASLLLHVDKGGGMGRESSVFRIPTKLLSIVDEAGPRRIDCVLLPGLVPWPRVLINKRLR
jgi:hypothetical protein